MGNVVKYLRESAERNPSRTAIFHPAKKGMSSISYSELWSRIDKFSSALASLGLEPGDRVIVMIPMSVELYIALLGIIKLGALAVFADPWVKMKQIVAFCRFASPKGFIGIPKSHILRLCDGQLRNIPLTVSTGSKFAGILAKFAYGEIIGKGTGSDIRRMPDCAPALITFTTGSSGIPKGANRTHGFLDAQNRALNMEFPIEDSDTDMPMFPVFALRNLAAGISSVFPEMDFKSPSTADAGKILEDIKKFGVNTITASPPFIDRLAARISEKKIKIPMRRILSGGAPVRDEQLKNWRKAFENTEIIVVYGSTEAEPVAHISLEERLSAKSSAHPLSPGFCAGRPSSLVRTKIIGINQDPISWNSFSWKDLELETGRIGELIVSGDHVCRDYFNNPHAAQENKIVDADGNLWHRMGDTGYFDEIGRFWLAGRVHSTIFRNGIPVHPQLLEQAAKGDDPRISMVAAIGMPDTQCGEKVAVIVSTAEKSQAHSLSLEIVGKVRNAGLPLDFIGLTDKPLPLDPRHNSKIDYELLKRGIDFGSLRDTECMR